MVVFLENNMPKSNLKIKKVRNGRIKKEGG